MKKKLWWIISGCVVLCVLALALTVGYYTNLGYGISEGRYLQSDGGPMLIVDGSPICMSVRGSRKMFDGLSTGDKMLVIHDGIAETYPGQTGAYWCRKLEDGSITDIPEEVRKSLQEMGWYANTDCDPDGALPIRSISYQNGCFEMSLDIPEAWEYRIDEYAIYESSCGISFWPAGYEEKPMSLWYYPNGFGTCGTGLTFDEMTVNGYAVSAAFYTQGGVQRLEHMYFTELPGDFAVVNRGLSAYWGEFGEQIMQIMQTVQIRVDAIGKKEALEIAKQQYTQAHDGTGERFDHTTGTWMITFYNYSPTQELCSVTISSEGEVQEVTLSDPTGPGDIVPHT